MTDKEKDRSEQLRKKVVKSDNLSDWYIWIIKEAELADYGPVKGTMVIRPTGYALWEGIQRIFNEHILQMGVRNAYYPLFIPMNFFEREKEHVEGFSPELAVVTHGGGKKLEEPIAVRPTSETIMYAMYSKWIGSYRDLPLKHNQWCNVVRWEKRTLPFLRTLEFLWQEGHTAHATHEEAADQVEDALKHYAEFLRETLALPIVIGKKTKSETFAGALYTLSCEALMPDGKALQVATSHHLGQNFSKKSAFDISFNTKDKTIDYVHQTSWGLSTRVIGGLVMTHGDDKGIIVPPRLAAQQVVIIPIYRSDEDKQSVMDMVDKVVSEMNVNDISVEVDDRDNQSPGFKFHDWEMKGVPIRVEIGPKDVQNNSVVAVRRDTGDKESIKASELTDHVKKTLDSIQATLYERATKFLESRMFTAKDMDEFAKIISETPGMIKADWCGSEDCEADIKEKTKATARVIPFDEPDKFGPCIVCGKEGKHQPYWAKSY